MEACGIDVYLTARNNVYPIEIDRNRRCPQNYYGLVLLGMGSMWGSVCPGIRLHACRNTVCWVPVCREDPPSWGRGAWRRRGCCCFVGL